MKKLILILTAFFVMAAPAVAIDLNLAWDASTDADGYKIYQSTDNGASWDAGVDVGNVLTYLYPNVPDTGMVIFRISAYNSQAEIVAYRQGVWYNGDFVPPTLASGFGIK